MKNIKSPFTNIFTTMILLMAVLFANCGNQEKTEMTRDFERFLSEYEAKVIDLSKEQALAYFEATISGAEQDYKRSADLEFQLSKIYASKEDFVKLSTLKQSNAISNPLLKRQLEVLYNAYLSKQIDEDKLKQMIDFQSELEKKYNTFRAEIDGKKLTDNEIEDLLKNSTDSAQLKKAWLASKKIGEVVAADVLKLVKMRNEAAQELGFDNYHTMQLSLSEQDPEEIESLFNELDTLTRDSFAEVKSDVDNYLAARYQIPKEQLKPWHYQNRFFQEAPRIYPVDLDKLFQNKDVVEITKSYYASLGLPIDDLIAKSDLFEKEGKYQHAYCIDIDKQGDVRVVCNVKPNYNWMNTMLHEFGHAVYDKFNHRNLPWVLREPAHTFTTEAIAMLFGRFASNPAWLRDVLGVSESEIQSLADASLKSLRLEQLVFSRWAQVMYRFEKSMYENPQQDLNHLWWELVEKYQMVARPANRHAPDWAAKIHVALYPAYYHNYLMGELLASQLYYYIINHVLEVDDSQPQSFAGKKSVGEYLVEEVFKPGKQFYWNDMIEKATGEKLTARYFARQFL
ncbi:MAG: M2 family metallopeptidase [bacterium]